MPNKWLVHIKKTMKQMKAKGTYVAGKGLGQVIKAAKKTWHHAKKSVGLKGGADGDGELVDVPLNEPEKKTATTGTEVASESGVLGGRRRKTRRRRHSRRR